MIFGLLISFCLVSASTDYGPPPKNTLNETAVLLIPSSTQQPTQASYLSPDAKKNLYWIVSGLLAFGAAVGTGYPIGRFYGPTHCVC